MINNVKKWIVSLTLVALIGGALFSVATPQITSAAGSNPTCAKSFLLFPVWYRGVVDDSCNVKSPSELNTTTTSNDGLSIFIWHIVLNIIEIGLVAVGYIAVFFILYGGFQFLTSQGSSDRVVKAKTTITNAVIGLVISLVSSAIINFIMTGLLLG